LNELDEISGEINQLKSDFSDHKKLLDNSLYPDNFDRAIEKLRISYNLRKDDFTQIDVLQSEVIGLRETVDTLNRRNAELQVQFVLLEEQSIKDRSRIVQLEKMVAQLKTSISKRDQIVMSMVDSLLPPGYNGRELSQQEKHEVFTEAEKNNVLSHIKRAVNDNIRFLDATMLYPDDIEDVKDRQDIFTQIWRSVGPTMVEIYAEKGKSTNELKEIDDAFTKWHEKLTQEAWASISEEFKDHNIKLRKFSNGREFTSTITSYIDNEIRAAEMKDESMSESAYKNFADSTWFDEINSSWIPFLVDNEMLAEEQKDSIEIKIASWKDSVYPAGINWLYVIIGVLVAALILIFFIRKSAKKEEPETSPGQTD
jgi:DNA repair ATPase RecN